MKQEALESRGHCQSDGQACGCSHEKESGNGKIIRFAVGVLFFTAGFFFKAKNYDAIWEIALFAASYAVLGGDVLLRAIKNIFRGKVFDENFLMSTATIGAFAIGEFPEAAAVMLFYQIGEYFQSAAVRKSKKSIADLMDIRPDYANVEENGKIVRVEPDTVKIDDLILVKPGEKIPLDGIVAKGSGHVDTKSITGESLPRFVSPGDAVLSGCVSQNSLLTVRVTKVFRESTVSKIIDLVENASAKKAQTENFITAFSRYYTPAVVILAAMIAAVPPLLAIGDWPEWIRRGLIFLVISCPCALVISIPLSFFGGIGGAARKGILIKGGNFLEALSKLDIVVFDKTGTLTKGAFEVTKLHPAGRYSETQLLELAALSESCSNHPIALSICRAYGQDVNSRDPLSEYVELEGRGVKAVLGGKTVLAGNGEMMKTAGISFSEPDDIGAKVHVAYDGEYAGCIVLSDEVKPDSRAAIDGLTARGVRKTVMLTGDERHIADSIAKELSLNEVHSSLLPHEKVGMLEKLSASKPPKGKLAFVGDGINDAPALALADIGVAMGGFGSDAAIEAADVVFMTDEPSKLVEAIDIARFTKRVARQNIALALGVKCVFLLLGALGAAAMWEAVFADVGVALLAILNATRAMRH